MRQTTSIIHARVVRGSGGGPDKTILSSARYLEEAGFRFGCLYLRDPTDQDFEKLVTKAVDRGVSIVAVDDLGAFDWRIYRRLRSASAAFTPYVWHGHDYKTNLLGLGGGQPRPARLVTTVHGWVHRTLRTPLYYAIDRWSLKHYDAVLCVSEDLLERCERAGVSRDRLHFVPNAVDTDEFERRRSPRAAKADLGVPPVRSVIGAVGRLSAEKGFDILIRAVDELLASGVDCEAWIIGEGDRRDALSAQIQELGRADRIKLLGHRLDVRPLYEAMDLLAVSSLREGLPNVVLEAMAMALPVVATRVAGIPLAIRDRDNGIIVEPDSVEALKRGLEWVLSDPARSTEMGRHARKHAVEALSFQNRIQTVLEIYYSLGIKPNEIEKRDRGR